MSYSLGQFHFETDGFRENNDLEEDIYNAFLQVSLSHKTSVQAEFRYTDSERGDLFLRFNPENFLRNLREKEQSTSIRFGLRHTLAPNSDIVASVSYRSAGFDQIFELEDPEGRVTVDRTGYSAEVQHLFRSLRFNIISGIGHFTEEREDTEIFEDESFTTEARIHHANLYLYTQISYPKNVTWTLGGSVDFFEGGIIDRNQFNPKIGLTWNPLPTMTLRVAVLRTFKRTLLSDQTLEPNQVAGFIQFFDDAEGTDAWRYGIGLDQKFSTHLYVGAELSLRNLRVPGDIGEGSVEKFNLKEQLGRAYMYWTLCPWLAFSTEYQYEHFKNDQDFIGPEEISRLTTHRVSFGLNFFHPLGFIARLKPTYINQDGKFGFGSPSGDVVPGDDQFCPQLQYNCGTKRVLLEKCPGATEVQ